MSNFIPVDITEDAVKSVTLKLSGSSEPLGTELEAPQGRLLKISEYNKRLHTGVENFLDWLANKRPSSVAYRAFMSGCLIALDKPPGVRPSGVRET